MRALYLAAGAIDAAVEAGDDAKVEAIRAQFDRTLARRTYITGGMGSRHMDESFGEDFELPPDVAYCETCAGVAAIQVAHRLLLWTGEESYADVIEQGLFNVLTASLSAEGGRVLLREPAAAAHRGRCYRGGRAHAAGELAPARAVVHRLLLPHQHCPRPRIPALVRGDHQR